MNSETNVIGTVYMQGDDAKAINWTRYFTVAVVHFTTLGDLWNILRRTKSGDIVIYRYQNCPAKLSAAIVVFLVISLQLLRFRFSGVRVMWICHNVDQDTQPYHKWLERLRRRLLAQCAEMVFVLDPSFVEHCMRRDAIPISFGVKYGGHTKDCTVTAVRELAQRVDKVVLIAGQDGSKYKAFECIPQIHARFAKLGLEVGFVTAGMMNGRRFDVLLEDHILRVNEPNLRESDLVNFVNYVYRENDDISMPYSVYSAATAGLPILTRGGTILAEIVLRDKIGVTLDRVEPEQLNFDFDAFLNRNRWSSLRDAFHLAGVLV